MVLIIIHIYLQEYSDFFHYFLAINEPPNNCDALARTEPQVQSKVLLLVKCTSSSFSYTYKTWGSH
jgi:hypothetical protein